MGHVIKYHICDATANLEDVEFEINERISEHMYHKDGGLNKPIRWIADVCANETEAYKYLRTHDRGDYDQLAVKFYVGVDLSQTAKLWVCVDKCRRAYEEKSNMIHYASVKSEFIGCKECGSRIARRYIQSNLCPVCHVDLRPQRTLDSIAKAKAALELAEKQYNDAVKEQQRKQQKHAKIKWLIKYEYYM